MYVSILIIVVRWIELLSYIMISIRVCTPLQLLTLRMLLVCSTNNYVVYIILGYSVWKDLAAFVYILTWKIYVLLITKSFDVDMLISHVPLLLLT